MKKSFIAVIIISLALVSCNRDKDALLFVGGYTSSPGDKGLSVFSFDGSTGTLKLLSENDAGPNPSYFALNRGKNLVYAADEVEDFEGKALSGGLVTLKFDRAKGTLQKVHSMAVPNGGPCFISMSPDSNFLFIANYPEGAIDVVKLTQEGIPSGVTQTIYYDGGSHAHMIMAEPSGKRIFVTDLGLDKIRAYRFDNKTGKLEPADSVSLPQGTGPRHFVFNADGSKLYVIDELASKIMTFKTDNGITLLQTLPTTDESFKGQNACADVHIDKTGKFIYGSNRGENTIVTYSIQPDGTLKLAGRTTCGGNWPRNFNIDPAGNFLLVGNQRSDSIAVFRIDKTTGIPGGTAIKTRCKAPVCMKFFI